MRKFFSGWGEVAKTWIGIFIVLPIILLVLLSVIFVILKIILGYIDFGKQLFGFENGSFGVILWVFVVPLIFLHLVEFLFKKTNILIRKFKDSKNDKQKDDE